MTRDNSLVLKMAHHYVLTMSDNSFEIWRLGRLLNHRLLSVRRTEEGWHSAASTFAAVAPTGYDVVQPGPPFRRRALTRLAQGVGAAVIAVVVVVAVLGIAVADSSSNKPDAASLNKGWIYVDAQTALFLSWTRTGNETHGSLQIAQLEQATVHPDSNAFTGVISGNQASLTFPEGLGTSSNVSAQISGSDLILSLPQRDGTILPVTMKPGTTATYNSDVAQLQNDAARLQGAAIAASESAASASAAAGQAAEADNQVDQDAQTLTQAVAEVTNDDQEVEGALGEVSEALAQEKSELAATQSAATSVEAKNPSTGPGQTCADAGGVGADAGGVQADQGGVAADLAGLTVNTNSLQGALADLRTARSALATAISQDPSHAPTPVPPTGSQVSQTQASATGELQKAASTQTSATAQAVAWVAQANNAYMTASAAGNC